MRKNSLFLSAILSLFVVIIYSSCSKSVPLDIQEEEINYKLVEYNVIVLDQIIKEETQLLNDIRRKAYDTRSATFLEQKVIKGDLINVNNSISRIVNQTKLVLTQYGISNKELQDIFGSSNDPRIALLGVLFVNELHADASELRKLEWDDYVDCAMEAVGVNIFSSLRTITKKVALTMLKEVAKRAAGPAGVAITVAEFGWCLYRNS